MNRTAWYWVAFAIVATILVVFFCLSISIWSEKDWIGTAVGILGSLASLAGMILALMQIDQTKIQLEETKTASLSTQILAEKTNAAVMENKREIQRFLSFSDMGHLIEIIKNTQNDIRNSNYHSAVILMQQIKDNLLRIKNDFSIVLQKHGIDPQNNIGDISIDIGSLAQDIMKNPEVESTIDRNEIHKHLEDIRAIVITVENSIKQEKYDTPI